MKIVSVQFDFRGSNKYDILSKVFKYSVEKNCPDANLALMHVKPPDMTRNRRGKSMAANTLKLDIWLEVLKNTDDDVIFMDCDMIVLKDLSDAFESEFDIGYTTRTRTRLPFNGGVVFVKNTKKAIKFVELWKDVNKQMYENTQMHMPYRNKYAGMNQAAFGYILEKKNYDAKLKKFPCAVWNACDDDWRDISTETRAIHIKSGLRRAVLNTRPINTRFDRSIIVWQNLAVEAGVLDGVRRQVDNITVMPKHPLIARVRGLRNKRRRIV